MLLQKLPVLQSNPLVLKHNVLRRYKVEVSFFAFCSCVPSQSIKNCAQFIIVWIEQLSRRIPFLFAFDRPLLYLAQPSMMDRHALEKDLKFDLLFIKQTLRCLQVLLQRTTSFLDQGHHIKRMSFTYLCLLILHVPLIFALQFVHCQGVENHQFELSLSVNCTFVCLLIFFINLSGSVR